MIARILLATPPCDPAKALCKDTAGPGGWLHLFFLVAVIGIVLTAWLVLRGYRDRGGPDDR
jgi:hypothetical protein